MLQNKPMLNNTSLPPRIGSKVNSLCSSLIDIYGKGLVSLILYGSASSGDYQEDRSNVNLLVVLDDISLPNLSRAYPLINNKRFTGIIPIFFTEDFINSSLDVFPIEFLDLKESHKILYGKDIVSSMKIDDRNLRFQCEHELKSRLIDIRRIYLASGDRNTMEKLLFKTFTSAIHIMRNLIRFKGPVPRNSKAEILNCFERTFGVHAGCMHKILWADNKKMRLTAQNIETLLSGFISDLETVSSIADGLK